MNLIGREELYNDGIGFVELWDNSKANKSEDNRKEVVTNIASISFGKDKSKNPDNLYNRLIKENAGKPNTSFEFVPIVLGQLEMAFLTELASVIFNKTGQPYQPHSLKYGNVVIGKDNKAYIITNLRALLHDNYYSVKYFNKDISNWYNKSEDDFKLIYENTFLFKYKAPIFVVRHTIRHRVVANELSRRYTKGNFEFYQFQDKEKLDYSEQVDFYNHLVKDLKWKAEDARIVLPVALYTTIWQFFPKEQLDTLFDLRLDKSTQEPTRELAEKMKKLVEEKLETN